MLDLLLLTIPKVTFTQIQAACPIIKGVVKAHGYSCEIYDCNIEFKKRFLDDAERLSDYFLVSGQSIYSKEDINVIHDEMDRWIDYIIEKNPTYLGISLFSYESQKPTKLLCQKLKKRNVDIKIILGGSGVGSIGRMGESIYANDLYKQELIHAYVTGDGEEAILNILRGEESVNVNSIKYSSQIDVNYWSQFYPDYDDIDFDAYSNWVTIPITGSRGCVRQCSFCTEGLNLLGFRYRDGKNIADEMIHLSEKYDKNQFYFTDSLINGSMKAYREFIDIMSKLENKIDWGGYFICRPENQMTPEEFKKTGEAGASHLTIGIESGSENVRNHMKKKFSNEDMDYTIEQFQKNGLKLIMLLIVGYPYETDDDFEDTLDLFRRWKKYSDSGTIWETNIGSTCMIFPDTPLYTDDNLLYSDKFNSKNPMAWINKENPTLTVNKRIERYRRACAELEKLEYNYRAVSEVPEDWANHMSVFGNYVIEHEQEALKTKKSFKRDM